MMSVVVHKNLAGAKGYFSEHLSQNDYYAAGELRPGQWIGEGAVRLGLVHSVSREAFDALCENRHPSLGTRLTARQVASGERRVLYDFTCSAPKSVSVLAVTLEDRRLEEAHQEAALVAFRELERFAAVRVRKLGASTDRSTGNLVASAFLHTSSRALDPQLHTHFTVFNATWDEAEKSWRALQAGGMYDAIRYATQVYRNELAKGVQCLGYGVRPTENGFEIEGVSEAVIRRFSKRSIERDQVVAQMEERLGRKLSKTEVSYAVHQSRVRKVLGLSTVEVRSRQQAQLRPDEWTSLIQLKEGSQGPNRNATAEPGATLDHAIEHAFERRSVVPEHELLEAALAHRLGAVDLEPLKERVLSHPSLIQTDRGWTTRQILEAELKLLAKVREGKESVPEIDLTQEPTKTLGDDQRAAVRHVLRSADRITGIRGLAGSGKTTALKEISRIASGAGYSVQVCAPTAAATEVLRKEGFGAVTLARLLQEPEVRPSSTLTILDEAGAVGVSDMNRLLERQGRVILVGDTGQHASVAQGDALRIIEENSPYTFGQLSQIRRQRRTGYRQAVQWAADRQPDRAFDHLERLGAIREFPDAEIPRVASERYLKALKDGRSILLVAPTWSEIDRVTEAVRESLKRQGQLVGNETVVPTFQTNAWTLAQRRDGGQYRLGQRIRFHHAHGGFARNESVEVVGVGGDLSVRRADGTTTSLNPDKAASSCEVGDVRELRISAGDRLLLRANLHGFTNGQVVEVDRVDPGAIRLRDGRTLPSDYRSFTYGYAVTSHAAQGKTVDEVVVVASRRSLPAIHREQFYVSISRGRDECQILTDDREMLRRQIGRSSARVAAVEATQGVPSRRPALQRAIQWATQLPVLMRQWIGQPQRQKTTLRPRIAPGFRQHQTNKPNIRVCM